jgi:hypothetical protein
MHEMGDLMTRTVAEPGTSKYSEYPAMRGVFGGPWTQKKSSARGKLRAPLREQISEHVREELRGPRLHRPSPRSQVEEAER